MTRTMRTSMVRSETRPPRPLTQPCRGGGGGAEEEGEEVNALAVRACWSFIASGRRSVCAGCLTNPCEARLSPRLLERVQQGGLSSFIS